jgi:hypothetical protein
VVDSQAWSYRVEEWDPVAAEHELSSVLRLETILESHGIEGWELAGAISSEVGALLIFKRPSPPDIG